MLGISVIAVFDRSAKRFQLIRQHGGMRNQEIAFRRHDKSGREAGQQMKDRTYGFQFPVGAFFREKIFHQTGGQILLSGTLHLINAAVERDSLWKESFGRNDGQFLCKRRILADTAEKAEQMRARAVSDSKDIVKVKTIFIRMSQYLSFFSEPV